MLNRKICLQVGCKTINYSSCIEKNKWFTISRTYINILWKIVIHKRYIHQEEYIIHIYIYIKKNN